MATCVACTIFTICIEKGQQNAYAQMYALQRKNLSEVDVQTFLEKSNCPEYFPYPASTVIKQDSRSLRVFLSRKTILLTFQIQCQIVFIQMNCVLYPYLNGLCCNVGSYYVIVKRTFNLVVTVAAQSFSTM